MKLFTNYAKFPMSDTAVRLALRVQYMMGIYYSMTFYECRDIPTLATNGVGCWVNPEFWSQLSRDQKLTAVAHEMGHRMLLHTTRRGARDPFVWNLAGDYIINPMLVESGFVPLENLIINGRPWSWLYDTDLCQRGGNTTEGVYDILIKEAEEQSGQQGGQDGDSGEGAGAEGEGEAEQEGAGDGESAAPGANGRPGARSRAGSNRSGQANTGRRNPASAAAERRLGPMRDLCDFGTDPNGDPHAGNGDQPVESPAQFEQRVAKEVKEAEARAKMIGNAPGWMQRVVSNVDHSKVNWWDVVEQHVKALVIADYSWSRFSRRELVKTGVISPDMWQPVLGHMLIIFDTSGSMSSQEFGLACRHFNDMLEQLKPRKVTTMYCDTRPTKVETFDRAEIVGDEQQLHPVGGGGTDFSWFHRFIEEMEERPDVVLCMTDMYATFGPEPDVPFIWLSMSSVTKAPYGELVSIS